MVSGFGITYNGYQLQQKYPYHIPDASNMQHDLYSTRLLECSTWKIKHAVKAIECKSCIISSLASYSLPIIPDETVASPML